MDPITHTCSGILIGQGLRPDPAIRMKMLLVTGLAAFAPDFDSASYLWGADAYFRLHRTYTHTLVGITVLALVLAGIERVWLKEFSFVRLFALNLAGCAIHIVGDLVARWPLRLLWPVSEYNFTLQWTGDFDYVVLGVMVVAAGLSETDGFQKHAPWIIAASLLLLAAYFLFIPGWAAV